MSETTIPLLESPRATTGAAPGKQLAQARELQNLSAVDVARQLKLSIWQIEALEAGRYDRLPGPVFVRGFIRNYARLVKLDPEALLQSAGDDLPQSVPQPETPPSQDIPFPTAESRRGPILALTAVVIVGVLALYEFYWDPPEAVVTRPAAPAPASAMQLPPQAPAPSENISSSATPAAAAKATRPTLAVASAPAAQKPPPAASSGASRDRDLTPEPGERQVRLEFDEESWVEIRDRSGKAIFSQLNLAGTVRRVRGLPPLSVVVGNAHGVKLTYDDRPIDLARHTKIDVARLTLE